MVKDRELMDLVRLFDDSDEVVEKAVNNRMLGRGENVMLDLRNLEKEMPERRQVIMKKRLFLNSEFRLKEFENFFAGDKADIAGGFSILASLFNPDYSKQKFFDRITQLSVDYLCEINEKKTAIENVKIFNHIFFNRLKFFISNFGEPVERDIRIDQVLDNRKGAPVLIGLVYFILAREAGLNIYPYCFPGGMIPAYSEKDSILFYVNIFNDGEIIFENRLGLFLRKHGITSPRNTFEVRNDSVFFPIYLSFLKILYDRKGDVEKSDLADRALRIVGGDNLVTQLGKLDNPDGPDDDFGAGPDDGFDDTPF